MADKIQNGQSEHGTVHLMEEEMRAAGQGVFEPKSGEAKAKAKPAAKAEKAPANKARKAAPSNKSKSAKAK